MGLPRVWGRVEAGVPIGPVGDESSGTNPLPRGGGVLVAEGKLNIGWTAAYYVLLFAGAVGFGKNFWVLTNSAGKLAEI